MPASLSQREPAWHRPEPLERLPHAEQIPHAEQKVLGRTRGEHNVARTSYECAAVTVRIGSSRRGVLELDRSTLRCALQTAGTCTRSRHKISTSEPRVRLVDRGVG